MKSVSIHSLLILGLAVSYARAQVIYNSASTAAEGYANGMSNVIQSRGQKNLDDSQARINNQDAYSKALDNSTKSVNTFWEQKDIYNARQQQQFAEYARQRQAYLARHGLQSFTPEEFDRATGTVNWLKVLEQKQYDKYRLVLDQLLKQRAYAGALTSDEYIQATTANKEWRAMLAKQKGVYPEQILDQMIKFVLKVNREINENLS
jgi:hypothetical protein